MKILFKSRRKPLTLKVKVLALRNAKIRLVVKDAYKPHTVYTNRYCKMKEGQSQVFFIRMPISPDVGVLCVMNELNGNMPKNVDKTFRIIGTKMTKLERKLNAFPSANPLIVSFVKFAQEFSQDAGVISANQSIYASDDGEFVIRYVDDIISKENGRVLSTPARISQHQGVIEIAKNKFKFYTVPMRMAILLHEYSHYYMNKNMADETEADLNALLIYLGLGYPRIEAYQAFLKVFIGSPSEGNKKRFEIIHKYITDFEDIKTTIQYSKNLNVKQQKQAA
jgi:hypothetical protein